MYENCQVSSISSIISDDEFNKCMESLGPFESSPEIAVAVSGGSDSLCLAILSNRWVKKRGGKLLVLTVQNLVPQNLQHQIFLKFSELILLILKNAQFL